jgi:hypothetical protein
MIPDRKAADSLADGGYDACRFVSEHQGQGIRYGSIGRRQIAVADPARGQSYGGLTVTRGLDVDLFDDRWLAELASDHGFAAHVHARVSAA